MIAILADAIDCFQKYGSARNRRRGVVHEAEKWLISQDTSWPFSFENICDVLGIDAGYLRRRLIVSPTQHSLHYTDIVVGDAVDGMGQINIYQPDVVDALTLTVTPAAGP